ncbi:serine/threonine protein phosphatase [Rivularia sp. PCC 7116]|uniref:serine/threonine phosphatase n=1 Tax=Rivularia sp. PCC 7116 TaxID=373994 RepID=UPI00029F4736|nr:serine/threonine phosphatase [Rivularia sp. PCC 7116]AFY56303.1 serine/threonine protein phosphatase [Rivularia sp. PCC 7116]
MLICPQCNFENPNSNKFCQNCGASLTEKECQQCGVFLNLDAVQCHSCDATCSEIWLAMAIKSGSPEVVEVDSEKAKINLEDDSQETDRQKTSQEFPRSFKAGSYLDSQQRYKMLESLPTFFENAVNTEACVKVVDCQPYQVSPVDAMLANPQLSESIKTSVGEDKIPNVAKSYIALQPHCHLGIPPIHDAWQLGNMQVILLEDRSDWLYLLEIWQNEATTSLQIIHYFYQMAQLWDLLEPFNCSQSLLDLTNLRVDEDQSLALQRLHVDIRKESLIGFQEDDTPKIKALGKVWQALFRESQRTQFGSLLELLGKLESGEIETSEELRSRLQLIAMELEGDSEQQRQDNSQNNLIFGEQKNVSSPTLLQLDELEQSPTKIDDTPTVILPMQLASLENAGLSDVGKQRDHNEDYFGIETKINKVELPKSKVAGAQGLYILCDGMGGHAGGEVASELAVSTLREYFQKHWKSDSLPSEEVIREGVFQANKAIHDINQQDARSGVGRMGTTLVVVLIQNTRVAVAHVGDSRLYRMTRKGGLEQITVDHEVGQREISRGVEPSIAYSRPDAYQLTQALGPRDNNFIAPEVQFLEINQDTLFILTSDGLSDNDLLEKYSQTNLLNLISSEANLEKGVRDLIDLANKYNGHDNITAVLIRAKVRPNLESQILKGKEE